MCNEIEEKVKLHLGCGDVYLDGWINIDSAPGAILASENPVAREFNRTTIDKYYRFEVGNPSPYGVVADIICNIVALPYPSESVDEILIVGTFEHLSEVEANAALQDWARILNRGGKLTIDVPDLLGTLMMLNESNNYMEDSWVVRLIYGSQKNEYSYHKWGYTPRYLEYLCSNNGFTECEVIAGITHDYPMFTMQCRKE